MTTGAAYGAGIYLSPHAGTSRDYARYGQVIYRKFFNKIITLLLQFVIHCVCRDGLRVSLEAAK